MFKKLGIAIAAAVTVSVMSTSAFAGVIHTYEWFDRGPFYNTIPGTPGNGGGQNVGTTEVFTSDNGLDVTASFFTGLNEDDGTGGSPADGYWGHGLGVKGNKSNSLDAESGEGILFDFGDDVMALSSLVWESPNASGAADASVWIDGVKIFDGENISGLETLDLGGFVGSQILFMNVDTLFCHGYCNNNGLRVKSLVVMEIQDEEEVPEPTAIGLIGLGLIGAGFVARRRKHA